MGRLEDFLLQADVLDTTTETEVTIAPFPFPFRVKSITEGQNKAIRKECEKVNIDKKTRQKQVDVDKDLYMNRLVIACTVEPNLKSAELQARYGVLGAEALLDKLLKPGQFADLLQAVQDINGFADINEQIDDAKN